MTTEDEESKLYALLREPRHPYDRDEIKKLFSLTDRKSYRARCHIKIRPFYKSPKNLWSS